MDNRKSKMRKEYKINESNGEFRIIDLPDGRKNIILADGTDVAKKMGVSGIDKIKFRDIYNKGNSFKLYMCGTVPETSTWIVIDKDGGKMFPHPILYVSVYDSRNRIKVKSASNNHEKEAILDYDLNIVSLGWHNYIIDGLEGTIIVSDHERGKDEGFDNVVNIEKQKYLFDKWYNNIDTISSLDCFDCEVGNEMHILADNDGTILTDEPIQRIDPLTNTYKKDGFGGESTELSFVKTTDKYGCEALFTIKNKKLEKYKVIVDGKEIEQGEYEIEDDDSPNTDVFLINSELKYNWIGYDGKMVLKAGYDKELSEFEDPLGEKAFVIERDGKYNIVGKSSMIPLFSEDEWLDDITQIGDNNYSDTIFAVKRDGKCNIINPKLPWLLCLKEWADDILTSDENFVFVKYGEKTYIFFQNTLFECGKYVVSTNDIMFIYNESTKKWNAICPTANQPRELIQGGIDGVYDVDSLFPIVERDGKFAFFDTEAGEVVPNEKVLKTDFKTGKSYFSDSDTKYFWFDDVDPFDEDKNGDEFEDYTFEVYKNGEKYYSNQKGELTKIQSRQL